MSSQKIFKVGIICGSTRTPRVGPQITKFVHDTIQVHLDKNNTGDHTPFQLEVIDVADFNLPLFDEPIIPQAITDPTKYMHEHTRKWGACIASLDGFVFVTPQYNWNMPAALKNAMDFLFNEWAKKPAMIVSYGGHGGGKAADALRMVCQGLRMQAVERSVRLSFPSKEFTNKCISGEDLRLKATEPSSDGEESTTWQAEKKDIVAVWEDLSSKLRAEATAS